MRDLSVETISFLDANKKTYAIKDMTEYVDYALSFILPIQNKDRIDEIATRKDVYGEDSEEDIYKIIEMNIVELFESKFNLSKLKELKIPVR